VKGEKCDGSALLDGGREGGGVRLVSLSPKKREEEVLLAGNL